MKIKKLKIFETNILEKTKEVIKPSFELYKGINSGSYGFLFHFFIKEEFLKFLNIDTFKKLTISQEKTAMLEFENCIIEIPEISPDLEKYITEDSATMIFFKTKKGSPGKELLGTLKT